VIQAATEGRAGPRKSSPLGEVTQGISPTWRLAPGRDCRSKWPTDGPPPGRRRGGPPEIGRAVNRANTKENDLAKVSHDLEVPGQRTKRKAWGFTTQVSCSPAHTA